MARQTRAFNLAWYLDNHTDAQLLCMGYGALSLLMALSHKKPVAAAMRGSRELRRIFPSKPLSERMARERKRIFKCKAFVVNFRKGIFRPIKNGS